MVDFTSKKYVIQYIIVGMGDAFNGILLVFAAARCAAYLQAILTTDKIIFVVFFIFFYGQFVIFALQTNFLRKMLRFFCILNIFWTIVVRYAILGKKPSKS